MTRRRFWVYFLLFLFNMIAYTDRDVHLVGVGNHNKRK